LQSGGGREGKNLKCWGQGWIGETKTEEDMVSMEKINPAKGAEVFPVGGRRIKS